MKKLQNHPLCEIVPNMTDAEYEELKDSIYRRGLKKKIVLYEGKILDGRHRYRACMELGRPVDTIAYRGNDPIEDVIMIEINRRSLTPAQKGATVLLLKAEQEQRRQKGKSGTPEVVQPTIKEVAKIAGMSERTSASISTVVSQAPDLAKQIQNGEMTPSAAEKELQKRKEEEAKAQERARKGPPKEKDATGFIIPEKVLPIWERREEITDLMKRIATVENDLARAAKDEDKLFALIHVNDVIAILQNLHSKLKAGDCYAVCVTCNGRNPSQCTLCKGRGIISKFLWQTAVPQEARDMRKIAVAEQK